MGRRKQPEALRADPDDRVGSRRARPSAGKARKRGFFATLILGREKPAKQKRRGRGFVYWSFVVSLWAAIGWSV